MMKRSLITLLAVAGIASNVQADQSRIIGVGVNEEPGLDLNLDNGISADVGPLGFGFRGESSDEANYQKMKNNSKRKKYTGPCNCQAIANKMANLKNKDNGIILHLGIRKSQYRKLQQQCIDCGCSETICSGQGQ